MHFNLISDLIAVLNLISHDFQLLPIHIPKITKKNKSAILIHHIWFFIFYYFLCFALI